MLGTVAEVRANSEATVSHELLHIDTCVGRPTKKNYTYQLCADTEHRQEDL